MNNQINALGAVNLAALDELKVAQERQGFLTAQSADLTNAMTTLEDAIKKIDKESRDMLMDTYNQVNKNFGELFPELFGGGEAETGFDRRRDSRCGRTGDGATAGQTQLHHSFAFGW